MKKIAFILAVTLTFAVTSCSKESKINRKIQGEWKGVTIDDQAVQSGESYTMSFSKSEKDTGTGTSTYSGMFGTYTTSFTYTIVEDKMTSVTTIGNSTETEVVTINTYTKDKLEYTNSEGKKSVFEPK